MPYNSAINLSVISNPTGFTISGNNGSLTATSGDTRLEGGGPVANGQLLIGHSGDNSFNQGNLYPGTGILIESGAGSLTIHGRPYCVPLSVGAVTWTNMPAALNFFNASSAYIFFSNLAAYTGVRLTVNKAGTTGALNSYLRLGYLGTFNTTASNYLPLDQNVVLTRLAVQNTYINSGYQPIVAGARSGVYIALLASGGDGTLDPVFGNIYAEFI